MSNSDFTASSHQLNEPANSISLSHQSGLDSARNNLENEAEIKNYVSVSNRNLDHRDLSNTG